MEKNILTKFNIPLLLRKNTLNIRGVAKDNPSVGAETYFSEVEKQFKELKDSDDPADIKLCEEISETYSEKGWKQIPIQTEIYRNANVETLSLSKLLSLMDKEEKSRKLRVLAVDDVAVVLNAITIALGGHYEVFSLTKGEHVEKFLKHTIPELFLLDIEMPDMNGYDLIPVIRSFEEHKDTPIIFLTGNATVKNFQTSVTLGVSEFITKPVSPDTLLKKVKSRIVRKKTF